MLLLVLTVACGGSDAAPAAPPISPPPNPSSAPPSPRASETPSAGQPTGGGIPFPRLGMWWPNPWEQPLDDIARYDWVVLDNDADEFIAPLRAINPDIILLVSPSSNTCEVDYYPDGSPEDNALALDIPPEWFLTQVGTTLAQDVDAATTLLPVDALTVTDGTETYALFVPGDTALIEGESVLVEAVFTDTRTLQVQRGYVRPASAHPAGTRIAAHITFWPGTWLLNLSTLAPTATVTISGTAVDNWGDYNAILNAGMVARADWDGILIDRSDPDQSWLVGGSTARTIDPDQSNTLLTDYAAFDAAWNEGLRRFEQALRARVGPQKIIFPNWGMDNYDLLNGNNYEGFPLDDGTSYRADWHNTVFGPIPNIGGYFEWMAQGQQPNLTLIETYEDDSVPEADGDGDYTNPCDDPNFTPNYQKMRFGLATALLNDGYFSYEINTNGHGALCLLWFDEYDNAGQGRGYLGMPLGAAYRTGNPALGPDNLSGGDFETPQDLAAWDLWADDTEGYTATLALDTTTAAEGSASARVEVTQSAGTDWQVSLSFAPVEVISGTEYTLTFWAKADRERTITAWAQQGVDPWAMYLDMGSIALTTAWQQYEIPVLATGSDTAAEFAFGLGTVTGTVWLDGVHLQSGGRDIWRRDYENGIALVNATHSPQTVSLGGTFYKINGTQDPAVNDGEAVTEVTLAPLDGLILLRETQSVYLPLVTRTPSNTVSRLHVQGTQIVDESGNPVNLRGINMDTFYYEYPWDPEAPWRYADRADLEYLANLGVNVIRLGFHWQYFDDSTGFDLLDTYLDWCEDLGIYAILDMHVVPPDEDVLDGWIWGDSAAQEDFLALWQTIAARYASRAIVAGYDIYNEPAPPEADQWWDLAGRAVTAIRAVDGDHILFVENPLIEDGGFRRVADDNVVYSFHDYEPFAVSHAAADWVGDTPLPADYSYPGDVLTELVWADFADGAVFTGQAADWLQWDSGLMTVPAGVEFATLKPSAEGDAGEVWFDDFELEMNGEAQTLYNPGAETASQYHEGAANWFFWSDTGFTGTWSSEQAHSGAHSLKITADGEGYGIWQQVEWVLTAPIFRVQAGDTFRVRGWILAPQNNGNITLGLDYLNGAYETWDRARLLAEMQPYLDWAAAEGVPLLVGEFGCMSAAPGDSQENLVRDKISVMNEAGLHWTLWSFRSLGGQPGFGLYRGDVLDADLAAVLRAGLHE